MIDPSWAVLPVRDFETAKSRLALHFDPASRAAFAQGLLEHVLAVLRSSADITQILVVTDSAVVERSCRPFDAVVIRDPAGQDPQRPALAHAVEAGLSEAVHRGAITSLILMADLPDLEPEDITALRLGLVDHDAVLAPDSAELCTNAIALRQPRGWRSHFGEARSFPRHHADFADRGLKVAILRRPGLARDVDTPDDLRGPYSRGLGGLSRR